MILYVKTACPFCDKVVAFAQEAGIELEQRNIADDAIAAELIAHGGKRQVPYLVDGDMGMYESGDIMAYLEEKKAGRV